MDKMTRRWGWLVVAAARRTATAAMLAAALMTGMAACSNDDNMTDEPTTTVPTTTAPQAVSTVHVTVGAGISDGDGTTRADVTETVVEGKTQRTLTFTTGDKLFVYAAIAANTAYCLAGTVSIDESSISADGKSAKFTGDLTVYDNSSSNVTPSSWTFQDASNPIAECSSGDAFLIPKDAPSGLYDILSYIGYVHNYDKSIASDVNTLMKTALQVKGNLDATTNNFTLEKVDPIINCNLGGLTPGVKYEVNLQRGEASTTYSTKYTADADGKVSFAVSYKGGSNEWAFTLEGGSLLFTYSLGTKDLGAKVYNVTRAAATTVNTLTIQTEKKYNQAGSLDYVTETFGANESTWNLQTDFGLLKFKYMLCTSPGQGISLAPISTVTISDGDGHTYTVTDTRDNGYGGTLGFDTNFQFYVGIMPVSGKTLTITYDPHNSQYTYTGTVSDVSLAGGAVLDLGTVELVKTTN